MSASCFTARGVSPSPQVFSRGNVLRSTTTTSWPASANQYAVAAPAGPPPTTSTSCMRAAYCFDVVEVVASPPLLEPVPPPDLLPLLGLLVDVDEPVWPPWADALPVPEPVLLPPVEL